MRKICNCKAALKCQHIRMLHTIISHLNALSELLLLVIIAYICSRYLLPKYVVKIVTMNLKNGDVASGLVVHISLFYKTRFDSSTFIYDGVVYRMIESTAPSELLAIG